MLQFTLTLLQVTVQLKKIVIFGVCLIVGSVALALKKSGCSSQIFGV
jgi:hypothetical protein